MESDRMNDNTVDWLKRHCFKLNRKEDAYIRWTPINTIMLSARQEKISDKWIIEAFVDYEGKDYVFALIVPEVNDRTFTEFAWRYNKEVKKQPFHWLSNYYLEFDERISVIVN